MPGRRPGDEKFRLPTASWVSSVAIGWRSAYSHVVRPLRVQCPSGRPLATAVVPAGTSKRNVNVALSRGWSLEGKT